LNDIATNQAPGLAWHQLVLEQVRSLLHGGVQIVVHDGRVVQREWTDRIRLDSAVAEHQPVAGPNPTPPAASRDRPPAREFGTGAEL